HGGVEGRQVGRGIEAVVGLETVDRALIGDEDPAAGGAFVTGVGVAHGQASEGNYSALCKTSAVESLNVGGRDAVVLLHLHGAMTVRRIKGIDDVGAGSGAVTLGERLRGPSGGQSNSEVRPIVDLPTSGNAMRP